MANFGGTTQRDTEVRLPRATRVRPDFGVYTGQIYRGHVCTPVYTRTRMLYASVHPNPNLLSTPHAAVPHMQRTGSEPK